MDTLDLYVIVATKIDAGLFRIFSQAADGLQF